MSTDPFTKNINNHGKSLSFTACISGRWLHVAERCRGVESCRVFTRNLLHIMLRNCMGRLGQVCGRGLSTDTGSARKRNHLLLLLYIHFVINSTGHNVVMFRHS